jgi:CBS domain-containing protein
VLSIVDCVFDFCEDHSLKAKQVMTKKLITAHPGTGLREAYRMMKENKIDDLASDRKFLRNGDTMGRAEFKGMYVLSASESNRPHLRDRRAAKVEPENADQMFYGGCWANVLVRPWWQNHQKYGKRVNAGLAAVQFLRDDEPFGEGRISDDDVDDTFAPVGDDDSGFGGGDDDLDDL